MTAVVLVFGCAGLLLYDIWVMTVYGPDTTISAVINAWAYSYNVDKMNPIAIFLLGFVNGGLIVHFLGWGVKIDEPGENSGLNNK